MATKSRALFLAAESPYPMVGGGALRSASILEYLLQQHQTDVFCFRQPGEHRSELPAHLQETGNLGSWHDIPLSEHGKSLTARGFRNVRRALRGVPPLVDRFAGFADVIADAIRGHDYDVAVVEHFWCAAYARQLRPQCRRLVLDLHNVESLWHRRCARVLSPLVAPVHLLFARAAARLEQDLMPLYDLVLATSAPEHDFVTERFPDVAVAVVPNTIRWQQRPAVEADNSIVFSGNMEYLPNQKAVLHFARNIWPAIHASHPRLQWKILGKAANQMRSRLRNCPMVRFVPDPVDAMMEIARSAVAVVPLTAGTGTRLKIVEAWASGCPVVSTALGAEGLRWEAGVDILIHDDPAGFAAAVSRILEDRGLATRLADAGRRRFESSYTWDFAWNVLQSRGV